MNVDVRTPTDPTPAATGSQTAFEPSRTDVLRASPPLFANPWLDRFTRVHPSVPVLVYAPIIALLAADGASRYSAVAVLGWAAAGYVLWTLTEYWMHRVVFHFEPEHGLGARLHFLIHGVHHDHPNDPKRLVMPPSASLPLAVLFLAAFHAVFGPAWTSVGAGFLAGYVIYDCMHYALHHRQPRFRLERRLREAHMRHHFQDDTRGFGISAPYWDVVFGTASRRTTRSRRDRFASPS